MDKLLRKNEQRRLNMAETLFNMRDWMTIEALAQKLESSERILKYDFVNFQNTFDDFTIETSPHGVRLLFRRNKGLKTLYRNVLDKAISFRLLETIFLDENYSAFELADHLYISPSTLYRLIEHTNARLSKYNFQIETNPCRLIGKEEKIRHFFSHYFYEKYTQLDWPYKVANTDALDNLLYFFIEFNQIDMDFAYYNIFKLITVVNLVRFKHQHYVDTKNISTNFYEIMTDLNKYRDEFKYFENNLHVKVTNEFINQVFTPFITEGYSLTYDRLMKKIITDNRTQKEVHYLKEFLEKLAEENNLMLSNKEEIIFGMHNASYFEGYDPRSGYILYNRNQHFVEVIAYDFPSFYRDLYKGIEEYRKLVGLPLTEQGNNYLMYVLISYWDKLIIELRKKFKKIKILVISNRHTSHSYMVKDFLEYEFSSHLVIDIYKDTIITQPILEQLEHDLIVTNFPLPSLESKNSICIENIPTFQDISKIQDEIEDILLKRMRK